MIVRPHCTPLALVLSVCLFVLPALAQDTEPPTTAEDVILTTKTPLGEASIVLPAGAAVTVPFGEEEEVILREGPFHAAVAREDLVFPTPTPTPVPTPANTPPAAEDTEPTQPAVSWDEPDAMASLMPWPEDWRVPALAGAAVLFGVYSVFATAALIRRRRRDEDDD
jgi:hypothetical protein